MSDGTSLYSPEDLAEMLHTDRETVLEWRRIYGWPSIKIGKTIRFTSDQVEQILAKHSTGPAKKQPTAVPAVSGQTAKSASRRRAS